MAKINEITVDVRAKLDVDESTAQGCLKLCEIFANEHSLNIKKAERKDGTLEFYFIERMFDDE